MLDIFLIGGSPSSGSTLLVNLLNRHDKLICLPETGLFAHGKNLILPMLDGEPDDLGLYLPWLITEIKVSQALGWDRKLYTQAVANKENAFELIRTHIDTDRHHFLIEKTPENIFAFDRYLEQSSQYRVIVTTRDALSVVQSLMRRDFTMLEALLTWFAHSYETARLIEKYPSQVYHCSYQHLTREPEVCFTEVVEFLGVNEKKRTVEEVGSTASAAISGSSFDQQTTAQNGLQQLVDIASWGLSDASWLRSPSDEVRYTKPVNLIGMDFHILMDRIAFSTSFHGLLRPGSVEKYLDRSGGILEKEKQFQSEELETQFNSNFTLSLAKHYVPHVIKA